MTLQHDLLNPKGIKKYQKKIKKKLYKKHIHNHWNLKRLLEGILNCMIGNKVKAI